MAKFQLLQLTVPALSLTDATCASFTYDEGVSRPFRLEAVFISASDFSQERIAGKPASFTVAVNEVSQSIGGVILEFRVLNKVDLNTYTYAVVIVPRLALLDRTRQNEIFATDSTLSLKTLLTGMLDGSLSTSATEGNRGVTIDYRMHDSVVDDFPRSNITKFNESDLNFFSRTCENFGVFYFFAFDGSQSPATDTVVLGAVNAAFAQGAVSKIKFKPARTTHVVTEQAVTSLTCVSRPQLHRYNLRDYNYETADTDLLVRSTAVDGIGAVVDYGDRYPSVDEGNKLVAMRAEEEAWQALVFECESTLPTIAAGSIFTLTDHPISSYNTEYVVISAHHSAGQEGADGYRPGFVTSAYRNSFTAIPKTQTFRPRRVTPKPLMPGVFNAVVDTEESSDKRAVLDSMGRYRIALKYNEGASRTTAGKGSAPVRRSEPYAGASANSVVAGLHMPLVRTAEVMIGYENGDPDRPVILGAAFNSKNGDVATTTSNTINRLRTTGGLFLELDDGKTDTDPRYIRFDVPAKVDDTPPTGTYLRLGNEVQGDANVLSGVKYSSSTVATSDQSWNYNSGFKKASSTKQSESTSAVTSTSEAASGQGILIYTDQDMDTNILGASVAKIAKGQATEVTDGDVTYQVDKGQFKLTAYNGVTITAGTVGDSSQMADITIKATNTVYTKSGGDTYQWISGTSTKYTMGESFTMFLGFEQTIKAAISITLQLSGYNSTTIGIYNSIVLGGKWDLIIGSSGKLCMVKGDMKITTSDLKITNGDMKLTNEDFKIVSGLDGKFSNMVLEHTNTKVASDKFTAEQGEIMFNKLMTASSKTDMKVNFVTLESFM